MGYERNDRRYYGGGYPADRNGQQYGGPRARWTVADEHRYHRDHRGDRYGNDRDDDRGFFDRAGDEVRSWFGDDEAERRRREDERRYADRYGHDYEAYRDRGWLADPMMGAVGWPAGWDGARDRGGQDRHRDPSYRNWRDRQMDALDRDYDEYRRENQSRFDSEFHGWRQGRQSQRDLLGKVQEHQEVVGSDGQHVGTVDHVRGDRVLLTRTDESAGNRHHSIPLGWIQSVEDKVIVSKTADQARQHWRDEERDANGAFFGDGDRGRSRYFDRAFRR